MRFVLKNLSLSKSFADCTLTTFTSHQIFISIWASIVIQAWVIVELGYLVKHSGYYIWSTQKIRMHKQATRKMMYNSKALERRLSYSLFTHRKILAWLCFKHNDQSTHTYMIVMFFGHVCINRCIEARWLTQYAAILASSGVRKKCRWLFF